MPAEKDHVTVDEFAERHQMHRNRVVIILREDQSRQPDERWIPGAKKIGSKFRGEWHIPRSTFDNWIRPQRGRPPKVEE